MLFIKKKRNEKKNNLLLILIFFYFFDERNKSNPECHEIEHEQIFFQKLFHEDQIAE